MKKLFLLDIDGTIVDGSRGMSDPSQKTVYAINELVKDNYVLISSGRNMGLLDQELRNLNVSGYILCNGSYAEVNGEVVFEAFLDQNIIDKIMYVIKKNDGFYILESLNRMFVNDIKASEFIKFLNNWGNKVESYEEDHTKEKAFYMAMIGFPTEEACKQAEIDMGDVAKLARHNRSKSFDVNINGINKGVGAKKVMEYLGVDVNDTYCFGDGVNDLEMLQVVGHPVIMKNCCDELKAYNFEQTDDVLDEGFYNYLIRNKLIKPL